MDRGNRRARPDAREAHRPAAPPGPPLLGAPRPGPAEVSLPGPRPGVAAEVDRELGDLLLQRGWLNPDRLHQALASQQLAGGTLATCLLEANLLGEDRLLEALSQVQGAPAATAADLAKVRTAVLGLLAAKVAQRTRAVPFRVVGGELWVAMEEVGDLAAQDEIAAVSGRRLRPHVALEARVAHALESLYGIPCSERLRQLVGRLDRPSGMPGRETVRPSVPLTEEERAILAPLVAPPPPAPLPEEVAAAPAGRAPEEAAPASGEPPETIRPPASPESLEQRLERVADRQEIGEAVLDGLEPSFRRVLLFKASADGVSGWMGRGEGVDPARLGRFALGFDRPSVFLNLHRGAGLHLGPLPAMPAHGELAQIWGGKPAAEALVLPVRVRDRLVAAVYADRGGEALAALDLAELRRLTAVAAQAFEAFLVRKKLRKA